MNYFFGFLFYWAPTLFGAYRENAIYAPDFWRTRSFWTFGKLLAIGILLVVTSVFLIVGPEASGLLLGRRAYHSVFIGGGVAIVLFPRAILGRVGSLFTDVTSETGKVWGWFLLVAGLLHWFMRISWLSALQ